jgi:hypothetical protein
VKSDATGLFCILNKEIARDLLLSGKRCFKMADYLLGTEVKVLCIMGNTGSIIDKGFSLIESLI